ncbi:MAG: hypothetical protein ACPGRX_07415 [Bdellovibrionales bacterium]
MSRKPNNPLDALNAAAATAMHDIAAPVEALTEMQGQIPALRVKLGKIKDYLKAIEDAANATDGMSAKFDVTQPAIANDPRAGAHLESGCVALQIVIAANQQLQHLDAMSYHAQGGGAPHYRGRENKLAIAFTPGDQSRYQSDGEWRAPVYGSQASGYLGRGPEITAADEKIIDGAVETLFRMIGARAPHLAKAFGENYQAALSGKLPSPQTPQALPPVVQAPALSAAPAAIALPPPASGSTAEPEKGINIKGHWVAAETAVTINHLGRKYPATLADDPDGGGHVNIVYDQEDRPPGYAAGQRGMVSASSIELIPTAE